MWIHVKAYKNLYLPKKWKKREKFEAWKKKIEKEKFLKKNSALIQVPKLSIYSREQNYFALFAMRYPVTENARKIKIQMRLQNESGPIVLRRQHFLSNWMHPLCNMQQQALWLRTYVIPKKGKIKISIILENKNELKGDFP